MRTCGVLCGVVAICCVVACGGGIVAPTKPAVGDVTLVFRTVELKPDTFYGKRLLVHLVATNPHKTRRKPWRQAGAFGDNVNLRDEFGNVFECQGATPDTFLDPGQSMPLVLYFDYPTPKSSKFALTVNGYVFEQAGGWKFSFGRPPPPKDAK